MIRLPTNGRSAAESPLAPHERIGLMKTNNSYEFIFIDRDNQMFSKKEVAEKLKEQKFWQELSGEKTLTMKEDEILRNISQCCNPSANLKKPRITEISADHISKVIAEIETIGWEKIKNIDEDFHSIVLGCSDKNNKPHTMKINLVSGICAADWSPIPFVPAKTLKGTMERFEEQVERFSSLWKELDEIDANFCVLDPPKPIPRSVTRRRVAIFKEDGEQIQSIFVELYLPLDTPREAPCGIEVIGSDSLTRDWRQLLNNCEWDPHIPVFENLQNAVAPKGSLKVPIQHGNKFEQPVENSSQDLITPRECGICYVYRLPDPVTDVCELPDETCERCTRPFHRSCMVGWLRALPSAKRSFRTLFGECPYCGETITVKDE